MEEDFRDAAWSGLVKDLTEERLELLKINFHEHFEGHGLNRDAFSNVICAAFGEPDPLNPGNNTKNNISGNSEYHIRSNSIFDAIVGKEKSFITWDEFLDFLIGNAGTKIHQSVHLNLQKIECPPHMNRETIVKIVLIESDQYFCYTVISKHGRIGLYDGNLNFLTSYQSIMTREDINRSDDERRRRNRWVTDAVYCSDVLMLIVTNSARSIMIYEASGLKHVPYWLIIGVPDIIESLAYKGHGKSNGSENCKISVLFCGDDNGNYTFLKFMQPSEGLLRRKHRDDITLFYWNALKYEKLFVNIEKWTNIHGSVIRQIQYRETKNTIISCSNDRNASVVMNTFSHNRKSHIFKMERGCDCFSLDDTHKLLITGSDNGIIRLWNAVIVSKPIAIISGHREHIVDISIMSNQRNFLSFSRDGTLKLWDIETNKCLQKVKIEYPSFAIQGKSIEFGSKSIHPGPKRKSSDPTQSDERSELKDYFGISDIVEKYDATPESTRTMSDVWERSCILITCCNYIATIKLTFDDVHIENSSGVSLLPPPPLQNSVLIPSNWKISDTAGNYTRVDFQDDEVSKNLADFQFVRNEDSLEEMYTEYDINYKIAKLECKKLQMQHLVKRNAPYSALDIPEIQELALSLHLPIPENKIIKDIIHRTERILTDASRKDQIFSESSSSRSKSSRSSIVEFSH